ncbi:hypothetical protein Plhal703r1_c10g0052431 [Plasmopara halstedii]
MPDQSADVASVDTLRLPERDMYRCTCVHTESNFLPTLISKDSKNASFERVDGVMVAPQSKTWVKASF